MVFLNGVRVSAAENNMIELLEYDMVSGDNNRFSFSSEITIDLSLPQKLPLGYIDMLFLADDRTAPVSVSVRYNQKYQNLTVVKVTDDIYRAFGSISGEYADLFVRFVAGGSQIYTLMSCKVSTVRTSRSSVTSSLQVELSSGKYPMILATPFTRSADDFIPNDRISTYYQCSVHISDVERFDRIYMNFATNYASLSSVRVTYGSTALPFELNYIDMEASTQFEEYYTASGEVYAGYICSSYGKTLGSLSVDVSSIDRLAGHELIIWFNGDFYTGLGLYLNVSTLEGEVEFAETMNANWWLWAKDLLTSVDSLPERIAEELSNLFVPDAGKVETIGDNAADLAEDRLGAIYQSGEMLGSVTDAFVYDGSNMSVLAFPAVTFHFGDVPWTFGGWNVEVVPPGFALLIDSLKLIIDIVCTLAFVSALKRRFELLLAGGNA